MAFVAPVLGFMPKYHNSFIHSFDGSEAKSVVRFCLPPGGFICACLSLTLLDMRPGMYSSLEVLRLDLPRRLERLSVGTSLCLRHPGDALNLRLLLLRRRSLNPSSWTRFTPHKKSPDPPRGFFGDSGLSSLWVL